MYNTYAKLCKLLAMGLSTLIRNLGHEEGVTTLEIKRLGACYVCYVGFMWLLFLLIRLHLSGIWQG